MSLKLMAIEVEEEENEQDYDDDGRVCWWHLNGGEEEKIKES